MGNYKSIANKIAEGRGQGHGPSYIPWHKVREVPSRGFSQRVLGRHTGRVHHLLSLNEYRHFLMFDHAENTSDIREQFPLLPVKETIEIARMIGVRPPWDGRKREPWVLTTDQIIDVRTVAGVVTYPVTIKTTEDLRRPRALELLEIERRYWSRRNPHWGIVTEKEIPVVVAKNLDFIRSTYDIRWTGLTAEQLAIMEAMLYERLWSTHEPFGEVAADVTIDLKLPAGRGLLVICHLIAVKVWRVDLSVLIDPGAPLKPIRTGRSVWNA